MVLPGPLCLDGNVIHDIVGFWDKNHFTAFSAKPVLLLKYDIVELSLVFQIWEAGGTCWNPNLLVANPKRYSLGYLLNFLWRVLFLQQELGL